MTAGKFIFVAIMAGLLAACDGEPEAVAPAAPLEVTDEATGHYCGMLLADHAGPKGQVHLASREEPLWFSSVRDTIAFTRLPEEPKDITAIYVNDMGKAQNWQQPEPGTWTEARDAWFVIDSDRRGGMGAPEAVPFSEEEAAEAFRAAQGGRLVRFDDIPQDYVLGPVELDDQPSGQTGHSGH
jgi:copper chaperone NosL